MYLGEFRKKSGCISIVLPKSGVRSSKIGFGVNSQQESRSNRNTYGHSSLFISLSNQITDTESGSFCECAGVGTVVAPRAWNGHSTSDGGVANGQERASASNSSTMHMQGANGFAAGSSVRACVILPAQW